MKLLIAPLVAASTFAVIPTTLSYAYVPSPHGSAFSCRSPPSVRALRMSSEESASSTSMPPSTPPSTPSVPIVITGNNVVVTEAMSEYVKKKLERTVGKLTSSGAVKDCDVHLVVNKNPKVKDSHRAEVVTSLKGTVIRCAEDTPDMYASIDAVTDRLARKLKRYKERRLDGWHGGPSTGENLADVLESLPDPDAVVSAGAAAAAGIADGVEEGEEDEAEDAEQYVDPEAPTITKIKSYDLSKPISIQEAVFALDYIDHDFYVFRNEEDNEINVVYKRNAGGVGLIQPQ